MLTHLRGAEPVCARIENLHLTEQFDVALLAGNLINTPNNEQRAHLLQSCRRHLRRTGLQVAQWHPPELTANLAAAGLELPQWLDDRRHWFSARSAATGG